MRCRFRIQLNLKLSCRAGHRVLRSGMADVAWGSAQQQQQQQQQGVRFGLRPPPDEVEAGGSITLELYCQNLSDQPVWLFGFTPGYPRALRVSPPNADRDWIRVSFGDRNVLHPLEAFTRLLPGATMTTPLDLSFAFDRRGAGRWEVAFAYDPVKAGGRLAVWEPADGVEARTATTALLVVTARGLAETGIDEETELRLDAALIRSGPDVLDVLRQHGRGGSIFAARRVARILSGGIESIVGWNALSALLRMGDEGSDALDEVRPTIPHAEAAYAFARNWIRHRLGGPPIPEDLPFVTMLDRVIEQADQRGNFLLSWTAVDSPVHGTRRLEVLGRGERLITLRLPSDPAPTTRRSTLSPPQMQGLVTAIRDAAVWLLQPLRAEALPDEPRPSLEIQLALGAPFQRRIAMWNGEWRQGPAGPLAELLDRLSQVSQPASP